MSETKDIFEARSFKRLRDSEIIDVMTRAINITETVCWSAIYELRSRYPNPQAWGEFLRRCRNDPASPFWTGNENRVSDSTIKRWVRCGKLADQLKIKDFSAVGIQPSAFDRLTAIKGSLDVERVYHKIKGLKLSIKEVDELIKQHYVVATTPKLSTPEPRRMTEVIHGVEPEPEPIPEIEVIEPPRAFIEHVHIDIVENDNVLVSEIEIIEALPAYVEIERFVEDDVVEPVGREKLTDDEMLERVTMLFNGFNITMPEKYRIIDLFKRQLAQSKYPKRA